jgi:tetratricopeptide (TPR) repeat protein
MSLLSTRSPASLSSTALAVLIGLAAQPSGPARAQQVGQDLNDYLAVRANAPSCIDQSVPAAKRIRSCTVIIDLAAHGSMTARMRIAEIYVARATALQQKGDDEAALRDLETATNKDPRDDLPWIGLGNFYMAKSDYSLALESFDHAVRVGRKDPVAYDDRGAALVAMRRHDEALADFNQALASDPHDTTALSNRATLYLASDRAELAISDLTSLIRMVPGDARAFYNRGTAYERSNEPDKAVEDYRSAARLQPSFAPSYEALGRVLAKRDPQTALAELTEAIRRDPQSPALRSRAILYLSLKQFEPALRDFDQAIASDGSDNIAYLDRGVAEQELGDLKDALADYTRSIELDTTVPALADRGSAYARLGEREKARADFDAALAIEPNNVAALIGRADANYALVAQDPKRLAASLEDYTRVIEAAPKNAAAYFVRGNIHFDLKDFAAAYSDYSESLALDPNQPTTLFNRSLAAEHLGHPADAAKDRRAAHALDASIIAGAPTGTRHAAAIATEIEYAAPRSTSEEPGVAFATPRAASGRTSTSASASPPLQEVTIEGYRRIVVNGEERYCQTESTLGSHIEKSTVCLTEHQLEREREDSQYFIRQIQRSGGIGVRPTMCGGMSPAAQGTQARGPC